MLEVGLGGMTDEEYKAHFSMWAALKSPLLIGADLRELSAQTLSILNNPAVIAVNQDPLGKSAHRISRNLNVSKDKYGQGETQIWSGPLYPADQVVIFFNAADVDMEMSATLDEIFVSDGPEGSAPQTKERWSIYDLWAKRMDQTTAEHVVESGVAHPEFKQVNWYNSTKLPYAEGLKAGDKRLLGQQIGKVGPGGRIKAKVPRHAIKMYRLRSMDCGAKRYSIHKQEL
jgi:alpha-galactosidase